MAEVIRSSGSKGLHNQGSRSWLPLITLASANLISQVGNVAAIIILPWFVLEETGSAFYTGIAGFSMALPVFASMFFSGPLVDRLGYRRSSIISDLLSGATTAAVPLLYMLTDPSFGLVSLFILLGAVLDAPGANARISLVPGVTERANISIERATSILQSVNPIAILSGPALAGIAIASVGASNALFLNSASFLASATLIATLATAPENIATRAPGDSYLQGLKGAWSFIHNDAAVWTLLWTFTALSFVSAPNIVVLTILANDVYASASILGWMGLANGAGLLLGTALYGWWLERFPRWPVLAISIILLVPSFPLLALHLQTATLLTVMFVSGLTFGPVQPLITAFYLRRIPANYRGSVFGMLGATGNAVVPLGRLIGGALVALVGLEEVLVGMGVGFGLVAVAFLARPIDLQDEAQPSLP